MTNHKPEELGRRRMDLAKVTYLCHLNETNVNKLAKHIGVSQPYLQKCLAAGEGPKWMVDQIRDYFRVSYEDLENDEEYIL